MSKNRWSILVALSLFLVSSLVTGCSSSATKTQINIVLKAADVQPEDYPTTMGLKYMAKLLDEKTKDVSN
ncbi:hypothetical protein [Pelosinus sp. IPA-1]|uniref:hypothetical protein n=1 Tax=Pelosinus sp. IPA-1 TaxID=3029569 RepID=UPI00243626D6|nr:hypothetical protein [Pelosinus sp. IPA-1]GMA97450.1 hypothetical protein PIPA1_02500 [Pelosinus sp. IPA-1]